MIPPSISSVLFIQYAHPGAYPPVLHASRILQSAGWSVSMLGIRMPDQGRFEIPTESAQNVDLMPAPATRFLLRFFFLRFCYRVRRSLLRMRPDWLYVSDPMACVAAKWGLGSHPPCRIVYHEHDLPDWCAASEHLTRKQAMIKNARAMLARRADRCVVPNGDRAEALRKETGRRSECDIVWNCPSRVECKELASPDEYRSRMDEPLEVAYCGSLNEVRVPFAYVDALVLEKRARLTLIGYETNGSIGFRDRIRSYAAERQVSERLILRDSIPRKDVFSTLRKAHLAIATVPIRSSDGNMSGMLGASNKSFDGLCVGIPVMVSDLTDWRREFVDRGFAVACDPGNPASIADAWRWVADHPQEAVVMGGRGRTQIATDWNYESQFRSVLEAMSCFPEARGSTR